MTMRLLTAAILAAFLAGCGAAAAQDAPKAAPKAAARPKKPARAKPPAAQTYRAPAGLNTPSTDFSNVTPQIDDPAASDMQNHFRSRSGPRPSMNGGTPGMEFGF